MKTYAYLFLTNLSISAFTFGGGYVVIPMMRKYFVNRNPFLNENELLNLAAIAQSVPGAIAVNLAAGVAYKIKGIKGVMIAVFASILPAFIILSIISLSYDSFQSNLFIRSALKGMEASVVAIMIDTLLNLMLGIWNCPQKYISFLIPLSFIGIYFFEIHAGIILAGSVMLSLCIAKLVKTL